MQTDAVIIIAMESERRHLDDLLPGWAPEPHPIWTRHRRGAVVTITCGIGMVAAAAATEHAIATYSPAVVLNYGCAGAHTRDVYPGDVVIGNRVVHQGRMRFAPDGDIVPLLFGFTVPGEAETTLDVQCDAALVARTERVAATVPLPVWPTDLRLLSQPDGPTQVRTGTVSSGDIWLQDPGRIDAGHERTASLCEDMEAAAIGQICALYRVPFLTIKDVSNSEFHEATVFTGTSSALPTNEVGLRAAMLMAALVTDLGYS